MQMQKVPVRQDQAGMVLQDFLCQFLGWSRNKAKALLDSRQIFVNGRRIWMAKHALHPADIVEIPAQPASSPPPSSRIPILFENADYLVADKPCTRLSNGPDSVESDLRLQTGIASLLAVHRLDRDTTGCLLLAKREEAFDRAVELFKHRRILKVYHTIAAGQIQGPEQTIDKPIDNEPATTRLYVIDSSPLASYLKVRIDTGRTHQIRKHLNGVGHPVLGDKTYGTRQILSPEFRYVARQMLHAATLQFDSPYDGAKIRATAPLPKDFAACLKRLRLKGS